MLHLIFYFLIYGITIFFIVLFISSHFKRYVDYKISLIEEYLKKNEANIDFVIQNHNLDNVFGKDV